jgi:hypothetical protein
LTVHHHLLFWLLTITPTLFTFPPDRLYQLPAAWNPEVLLNEIKLVIHPNVFKHPIEHTHNLNCKLVGCRKNVRVQWLIRELHPYDSAKELKESISPDDWSDSNGESRRRQFPALSSPELLDLFGVAFFLDSSI